MPSRLPEYFLARLWAAHEAREANSSLPELPTSPPTQRPTELPSPRVVERQPEVSVQARSGPSCEPLEAITDLDALLAGPKRALYLLHKLACDVAQARRYPVMPSQVTLHQAQELLAKALGCHPVTLWRWLKRLKELGLVDWRAHHTTSQGVTRVDGTLFTVTLKAGHRAHLTHDDLSHQYRDLDGDRKAGRTAWAVLQGSDTYTEGGWYQLLRNWAVTPGVSTQTPLASDPCTEEDGPRTLQEVARTLPLIVEAHPTKRAALIGMLGAATARVLDDRHSRLFWCKTFWRAWEDEVEGRSGLQALQAKLERLEADSREWPSLRRLAALATFRVHRAV